MKAEYKIMGMAGIAYLLIMISTILLHGELLSIAHTTGQQIVKTTAYNTNSYLMYLILSIIGINLIIIWLSKKHQKLLMYFMHAYMIFAIVLSVLIISFIYISPLTKLSPITLPLFIITMSVCLSILYLMKDSHIGLFNVFALLIAVGFGAEMGILFSPFYALVILILLSIYDFIAVFITKNMLKMVKVLMNKDMPLPLMIVAGDVETLSLKTQGLISKDTPINAMALGLGDIVIPSLVISSLSLVWLGWGIIALCGAMIGLLANLIVLKR
ncbi:MAG: presenilin family intramembrane aspartyl protease, partial [Candidatus Micrarchaeaceae archaeon]